MLVIDAAAGLWDKASRIEREDLQKDRRIRTVIAEYKLILPVAEEIFGCDMNLSVPTRALSDPECLSRSACVHERVPG